MEVYFFLAVVLFLSCLLTNKHAALSLSFLSLFIVSAFRDISVGTDTRNYEAIFLGFCSDPTSLHHATEPGYMLLQHIVVAWGGEYRYLIILSTLVSLGSLFYYACKISRKPTLVVLCYFLLYFFFYSLNTVRQFIAIPFVLLSFYYLERGCYKKFYLSIFAGFLFHLTALVGLLALLFRKLQFKKKIQYWLLIISFLIGVTPFIQMFLESAFSFLPVYLFNYITEFEGRELGFSMSRFMLTFYCIILVRLSKPHLLSITILTLGICLINLFSFQPIVARAAQFFTAIQIAIIPNLSNIILKRKKRRYEKILITGSYFYMLVVWIYLLNGNIGEVVPYSFGW